MKKINFSRDNEGCFNDQNINNYAVSQIEMLAAVVSELQNGTCRPLHEVFADKCLYIVVPVTDENGTTVFEKTTALYVYDKECPLGIGDGPCPLAGGKMFDVLGRWWDIEDTDVAFTDEADADKMEFFSNLKQLLTVKANFINELLEQTPVELFGEDNIPPFEVVQAMSLGAAADLANTTVAIAAADEIIAEIGEEDGDEEEEE